MSSATAASWGRTRRGDPHPQDDHRGLGLRPARGEEAAKRPRTDKGMVADQDEDVAVAASSCRASSSSQSRKAAILGRSAHASGQTT